MSVCGMGVAAVTMNCVLDPPRVPSVTVVLRCCSRQVTRGSVRSTGFAVYGVFVVISTVTCCVCVCIGTVMSYP